MSSGREINAPEDGSSNYNWAVIGKLLISFATSGSVPTQRFNEYLDALRNRQPTHVLAISQGTVTVDSVQRKAAADLVKDKGVKIAVLVDSAVTRGLITALSWLGVGMKSFGPGQEREALEYLATPSIDIPSTLEVIELLRKRTRKGP